jgi:RNA polymerase sigma factor (TIGR02999 family)
VGGISKVAYNSLGPIPVYLVNVATSAEITRLLRAWGRGETDALDRLTPLVYEQLRRLAKGYVRRERSEQPLQATALVHEAYLRLIDASQVEWQDRAHFFAVAAKIMRRILIDAARARAAGKRGGDAPNIEHSGSFDFDGIPAENSERAAALCALDDALTVLARMDPRRAQVIELRFFGGLTVDETAQVLNVSPQTVMRDWSLARAWLARELR